MISSGPAEVDVDPNLLEPTPKPAVRPMNLGLSITARSKVYLLHDQPFDVPPVWVVYMLPQRQIKIIFDNGQEYPIDWHAPDDAHKILVNTKKMLVVQVKDKKPVEAFETNLLKSRNGKYIDHYNEL